MYSAQLMRQDECNHCKQRSRAVLTGRVSLHINGLALRDIAVQAASWVERRLAATIAAAPSANRPRQSSRSVAIAARDAISSTAYVDRRS
eukprot:6198409-Pleurochrysis_carterae.AAC.2